MLSLNNRSHSFFRQYIADSPICQNLSKSFLTISSHFWFHSSLGLESNEMSILVLERGGKERALTSECDVMVLLMQGVFELRWMQCHILFAQRTRNPLAVYIHILYIWNCSVGCCSVRNAAIPAGVSLSKNKADANTSCCISITKGFLGIR